MPDLSQTQKINSQASTCSSEVLELHLDSQQVRPNLLICFILVLQFVGFPASNPKPKFIQFTASIIDYFLLSINLLMLKFVENSFPESEVTSLKCIISD